MKTISQKIDQFAHTASTLFLLGQWKWGGENREDYIPSPTDIVTMCWNLYGTCRDSLATGQQGFTVASCGRITCVVYRGEEGYPRFTLDISPRS